MNSSFKRLSKLKSLLTVQPKIAKTYQTFPMSYFKLSCYCCCPASGISMFFFRMWDASERAVPTNRQLAGKGTTLEQHHWLEEAHESICKTSQLFIH
jgi:hypothetical protein